LDHINAIFVEVKARINDLDAIWYYFKLIMWLFWLVNKREAKAEKNNDDEDDVDEDDERRLSEYDWSAIKSESELHSFLSLN